MFTKIINAVVGTIVGVSALAVAGSLVYLIGYFYAGLLGL